MMEFLSQLFNRSTPGDGRLRQLDQREDEVQRRLNYWELELESYGR